jgi:hypothetical protein
MVRGLALIVAVALAVVRPALADEAGARDAMNRGNAAMVAGDADAALAEFRRAIAELPTAPLPYRYAGEALERLGRWPEAVASYQEYLRIRPDSKDAEDVRGRIERITAAHLTGVLTVHCEPDGAAIAIDGNAAGTVPLDERRIPAGNHVLELTAPGRLPRKLSVTVSPGATTLVDCVLDRIHPEPAAPTTPTVTETVTPPMVRRDQPAPAPRKKAWFKRPWVWAVAGAAVVAGGATIYVVASSGLPDTAGGDIHFP